MLNGINQKTTKWIFLYPEDNANKEKREERHEEEGENEMKAKQLWLIALDLNVSRDDDLRSNLWMSSTV